MRTSPPSPKSVVMHLKLLFGTVVLTVLSFITLNFAPNGTVNSNHCGWNLAQGTNVLYLF